MRKGWLLTIGLILFILIISYLAYCLFFAPLWQLNLELREKVVAQSSRLSTLEELSRFTTLFETRRALYEERLNVLNKVLPSSSETPTFFVEIEQLVMIERITLNALTNPTPPTPVDGGIVSSFQMNVSGEYFRVLSFLRHLLSFPKILNVKAISLSGGADISAQLDCVVYLKGEGQ